MSARSRGFRVDWLPGSDVLTGTCFCGATSSTEDPATLLDWLAGHPVGHDLGAEPARGPAPVVRDALAGVGSRGR